MDNPVMSGQVLETGATPSPPGGYRGNGNGLLGEDAFHQMVYLERKRTERSGKPFLLLCLSVVNFENAVQRARILEGIQAHLPGVLRGTDVCGWFKEELTIGVILTEIGETDINRARSRIQEKIRLRLNERFTPEELGRLVMSYQVYSCNGGTQPLECGLDVHPLGEEPLQGHRKKEFPTFLNSWFRQRCFLLTGDMLLISFAQVLSLWIRLGHSDALPQLYTGAFAFSTLLYPAVLYVFDLYNMEKLFRWRWFVLRTGLAVLFMTGVSASWFYLFPQWVYGRGLLGIQALLVFMLIAGWRALCRSLLQLNKTGISTLILGAGDSGKSVYKLLSEPYSPYRVTGFLDDDPAKQGKVMGSPRVLGTLDSINEVAARTGAKAAVLALPRNRPAMLTRKMLEARLRGLEIIEMPTIFELLTEKVPVQWLEDQWLLFSGGFDLLSTDYVRKIKRVIDFGVAGFLLFLTAPLMALTALAIRLESPGPVFYRQQRVGKGGQVFTITKFRSMRSDAEKAGVAQWATKRDPRVTRVGKWIRILRIDEIPQIWSVFKGDMSIVGPRPERPEFVRELEAQIPYYSVRHTVTPGITGWAQVKYPYGASVEDALHKLEYDLFYIKNMSIFLDIKILLRTIGVVLLGEGAR